MGNEIQGKEEMKKPTGKFYHWEDDESLAKKRAEEMDEEYVLHRDMPESYREEVKRIVMEVLIRAGFQPQLFDDHQNHTDAKLPASPKSPVELESTLDEPEPHHPLEGC